MPKNGPYDPDFRGKAVSLSRLPGKTIVGVARDLGISAETLRSWCRRADQNVPVPTDDKQPDIPPEVAADFEPALRECPHTAERLKTLTRIIGNGGYGSITNELETLLGGEPKTVRWALEHRPGIQELKAG